MYNVYETKIIQNSLLIHSLGNFQEIFKNLLTAFQPKSLCEIGVEWGTATDFLIQIANKKSIKYVGVDPTLSEDFTKNRISDLTKFYKETSIEHLKKSESYESYIIDGDHNYYTVSQELSLIVESAYNSKSRFPLLVLHDTWWPCGRRDCYYSPVGIPPEAVHSYDIDNGVIPNQNQLVDWGFRGLGKFYWAEKEGGEKNGVNTAVEDWLKIYSDYERLDIPAIFGVTLLVNWKSDWPESASTYWKELKQSLNNFGTLLARLEKNRIDLFCGFLEKDFLLKRSEATCSEENQNYVILIARHNQLVKDFDHLSQCFSQKNQEFNQLVFKRDVLKKRLKNSKRYVVKLNKYIYKIENYWFWRIFLKRFWKHSPPVYEV